MKTNAPENVAAPEKELNTAKKKRSKTAQIDKLLNEENMPSIPFAVVEAYKNIRVQLTNALNKINGKTVTISSSNASEGKSTTSVNIAITISQLKKKVVIVDADTKRSTIHQKLKIDNNIGCIDVLLGKADLDQAIKSYSDYLDVITCGSSVDNSSEIFDSPDFDEMLIKLKEKYDYVILDTPPINIVSDTLVIAKKTDGLLYVIRSSFTTYGDFRKSLASIEKLDINMLGVVFNAVDTESGLTYKYSKYGKYGKYGKYSKYGYYK